MQNAYVNNAFVDKTVIKLLITQLVLHSNKLQIFYDTKSTVGILVLRPEISVLFSQRNSLQIETIDEWDTVSVFK